MIGALCHWIFQHPSDLGVYRNGSQVALGKEVPSPHPHFILTLREITLWGKDLPVLAFIQYSVYTIV